MKSHARVRIFHPRAKLQCFSFDILMVGFFPTRQGCKTPGRGGVEPPTPVYQQECTGRTDYMEISCEQISEEVGLFKGIKMFLLKIKDQYLITGSIRSTLARLFKNTFIDLVHSSTRCYRNLQLYLRFLIKHNLSGSTGTIASLIMACREAEWKKVRI